MKFVIRRDEDGAYVSKSGSESSFTHYLQLAEIFNSREEAENNRCKENEYIEEVDL